MPFNGLGTFTQLYNWINDAAQGILIRSDRMQAEAIDIASGLSNCITKDGQTTVAANLPMAGFRHTGVHDAVMRNEYATLGQLQDGAQFVLGTIGGTGDAITAVTNPTIAAFLKGQSFIFQASASNTTATTIDINGIGAKAIKKGYNGALIANDIVGGQVVEIIYNEADDFFQMISPIPYTNISFINIAETRSASINMADNVFQRPEIIDYSETKQAVVAASTTDIDLTAGNVVALSQDTAITTFTFSNPSPTGKCCSFTLIRTKDATSTSRAITWPASVKWAAGTAPTLTQTANAVDIFSFITVNAGTTWYGFAGGLAFA